VENEAAQCGLQQTPSPVETEPNHRGYSQQVRTGNLTATRPHRNGVSELCLAVCELSQSDTDHSSV